MDSQWTVQILRFIFNLFLKTHHCDIAQFQCCLCEWIFSFCIWLLLCQLLLGVYVSPVVVSAFPQVYESSFLPNPKTVRKSLKWSAYAFLTISSVLISDRSFSMAAANPIIAINKNANKNFMMIWFFFSLNLERRLQFHNWVASDYSTETTPLLYNSVLPIWQHSFLMNFINDEKKHTSETWNSNYFLRWNIPSLWNFFPNNFMENLVFLWLKWNLLRSKQHKLRKNDENSYLTECYFSANV